MAKGVYVLKSNKKDLLKIGKADNFTERLKDFHRASRHIGNVDEKFEYLLKINCEDNQKLESKLHKIFKDKRIVGEWFEVTLGEIKIELEKIDLKSYNNKVKKQIKEPIQKTEIKKSKIDASLNEMIIEISNGLVWLFENFDSINHEEKVDRNVEFAGIRRINGELIESFGVPLFLGWIGFDYNLSNGKTLNEQLKPFIFEMQIYYINPEKLEEETFLESKKILKPIIEYLISLNVNIDKRWI